MATKVVMEALSPTMEEGRLVEWKKNEGDAVATGDVIAEVETDKAVMELVARADGVLLKQVVAAGETVPVSETVGWIGEKGESVEGGDDPAGKSGDAAAEAEAATESADDAPEDDAEEEHEVEATADDAPEDDAEEEHEVEATADDAPEDGAEEEHEVEATAEKPAAKAAPGGTTAPARATKTAAAVPGSSTTAAAETPRADSGNGGHVKASPLARKIATDRGIDLTTLQGSGPSGRIVQRDVEAAPDPAGAPAATRTAPGEAYEDVPLSQIRKTIARRLSQSIGPIPTFYLTADVDMDRMAEARDALNARGEGKVSFNDIILKVTALALSRHPECNAWWQDDHIRFWHDVHLSMAVAIEEGLITPVIRFADRKSLREINAEARDLAERARNRKLKPDEYVGGTFSVSNLGMFDIDHFTAIINPPEAGILAVGRIAEVPFPVGDGLEIRKRMKVTMSCDHRVIDGATGALFLQTLKQMLENPLALVY